MRIRRYIGALIALLLILASMPALMSAQGGFEDVIVDEEGDVFHWHGTGWDYNVERPNVDILRAELSESGGTVTIALTVKGEITDHENILFYIYMEDEEDGFYSFFYSDGYGYLIATNDKGYRNFEPDISGVGTDTLSVSCSLEDMLNPEMLRFTSVAIYEYTEDGWYQDTAAPKDAEFLPIDYDLDVEPRVGKAPLEVEITFSAENTGDAEGQIPLTVDSEPIYTVELEAHESEQGHISYTFDEQGSYLVEFGDQSVTVYVEGETDDQDSPYSDVVTDAADNVMRLVGPTEDDWIIVESPDVDILRVEIEESDGLVTVSLTLKGTIRDDPDVYYEIYMVDYENGEFDIMYNDGHCQMEAYMWYDSGAFGNVFEPATRGVGTDTLEIVFTREQIGDPDVLLISSVEVYDEGAMEIDMAGPDADFPEGYGEPRFLPVNYDMIVDYEPDTFPMDVVIAFIAENDGDHPGEINLYVNGDVVYTLELESKAQAEGEYSYTFDEAGQYSIEFMDISHTVFVSEPEDGAAPPDDGSTSPGDQDPIDDTDEEVIDPEEEVSSFLDDLVGGVMTLVVIILVVLVGIVLVIVLVMRKKQRGQEEDWASHDGESSQDLPPPPPEEN